MMPPERIFLGVGANLAPDGYASPQDGCRAAVHSLTAHEVSIVAISPWYRTAPVPASDQPWFCNAVVEISTGLTPAELLALLHGCEQRFGRSRLLRNEARVLDLDIVDYGGRISAGPPTLPHPRMHLRAFVLRPLADIAPDWVHPELHQSGAELLAAIDPPQRIEPA